ncbi:MAG: polyprenyl synthetase family protein [Nitrososphaerales archaeon]
MISNYVSKNENLAQYYKLVQVACEQIQSEYRNNIIPEIYAPVMFSLEIVDRPEISLLPFISYSLFGDNLESVVPQGVVYGKLLWGAGRTVDDVLDRDTHKNGSPTTLTKYGPNAAILSSLELTSRAASYLIETSRSLDFEAHTIDRLVNLITDHIRETTYGELNAIVLDKRISDGGYVSEDEVVEMLGYKVASWFYNPLASGCLVAGVTEKDCEIIKEFGMHLGIAYAIFNDIKDALRDFHDIMIGRANIVLTTTLNMTKGTSDETFLRRIIKNKSSNIDLERVRKISEVAIKRLRGVMEKRFSLAENQISDLGGVRYPLARKEMQDLLSLIK